MKTVITVMKKELARVFFDKKMVFGMFVFPVIIMVLIFGVMSVLVKNMQSDIDEHTPRVMLYMAPESLIQMFQSCDEGVDLRTSDEKADLKKAKEQIKNGKLDVIVALDEEFELQIENYQKGGKIPEIKTYYNPSEDYSNSAREGIVKTLLEQYRQQLLKERIGDLDSITIFTVDSSNPKSSVIQDDSKAAGKMLGMIVPYMILILLFAGVMSLGVDTIVGEKERGTIATMLVTPIKRSHIVYGKFLALMIISALSASIYGISMGVGMPLYAKQMGGNIDGISFRISAGQIIMLLAVIISQVFLYVALIALSSVFAKTIKEGSTYVMPAYMAVIICGMMTMYVTGEVPLKDYFIPVYGSSMALRNILTQEISAGGCLAAVAVNLFVGILMGVVVTKAYNNEKVMFNA